MFGFGKKKTEESPKAAATLPKPAAAKKPAADDAERSAGGLKVKVKDRKACVATLSIQVPEQQVEAEVREALAGIGRRVRMPGFRPGKAPPELVRKNFEGTAREEAVERVLRKTVPRALEEEKLSPVAAPVVEKLEHEPGRPLRFELKVECAPDFEPKNYKGLALEKKTKVFSEADVDARLKELREANAKLAASEAAEAGDAHFLVVDYAGTVEGKPLEGAEAKGQLIDMAAPQRLAGFSEGLKGAKAGETRDVSVSLPEDYPNKDLAGKPAVFHVTVQEIKEKRLPALDDEFAKDLNFENLQALRDAVRKSMEAEFERDQRRALEKQTADALLEANAFDVPPSQVEEHARYLTSQLERFLRERGAGDAELKANQEKLLAKNRPEAERQVRLSYLLAAIAREEKLEATDPEVDAAVSKSVDSVPAPQRAKMKEWMESRRSGVRAQMTEEKTYTFLIGHANVSESPEASEGPKVEG